MSVQPLLLLYASHNGHTGHIARWMKKNFATRNVPSLSFDLQKEVPEKTVLTDTPLIVILAPIRFGYHFPVIERFIRTHKSFLKEKPLVLVSINLTARKDEKNTPLTNPYFRKWQKKHKLTPALSAVFGGRLDYRKLCKSREFYENRPQKGRFSAAKRAKKQKADAFCRCSYSLYKTWEKWAMRFIMSLSGGPTSFDASVDYTDWKKLDALVCDISDLYLGKEAA